MFETISENITKGRLECQGTGYRGIPQQALEKTLNED